MKQGDAIEVLGLAIEGFRMRETSQLAIVESINDKSIVARFVSPRDDGTPIIALELSAKNRTWR